MMIKQQQTRSSTGGSLDLNVGITDSMKKKFWLRQFFFGLYNITRIALSITIVVLISSTDHKIITQNKPYLRTQQILQIWNKDVIIDMITVSTYNCPKGYESYTSASWPGTKQGCLCSTSLNQYDYVHVIPGQCSLKLINAGCSRIQQKASIPFVFWRTKKLICVKRIKGLNFYTNLTEFLPNKELKNCSQNTNFQFQSLKSQGCPITVISNQSTTFPQSLLQINFSLNRQTSYPIVDIKMSEYSFCKQYNKSNISPNRFQNYDLEVIQIKNCEDDQDPRVKVIDEVTQKLLFQNNQRIYDIITFQLPIYPKPNEMYLYKLGTVQYPPWSALCRHSQQYNLQKTKNILQFAQPIQKSQTCIYLTALMIFIWGFLYSIVIVFKRIVQLRSKSNQGILFYPDSAVIKMSPNLLPNQLKLSIRCEIIIFIILLAIAFGLFLQLGLQYEYVSKLEEWMRNSLRCMDNSTYFQQWISEGYLNFLQFSIRYYLICILSVLVIVCIDIIFTVWRFNKGDLQDESIKDIFANNDQKNSDQQLSDRRDKQIQKEIIDNPFDVRQQTGYIDIFNLRQQSLQQKPGRKGSIKKNKQGKAKRPIHQSNNLTEQSFAVNEEKNSLQKLGSEIGKIRSRSKNIQKKISHLSFEDD